MRMKKYLIGCYAVVSVLSLASCQEDVNEKAPVVIGITSPQAGEKVWLNTSIKVETSNAPVGTKVMFYLDDELLGEDTDAPYELIFDSRDYEDGNHTLRAVAYDEAGNQTKAEQQIEVSNRLLKVRVEEGRYEMNNFPREWIIISDAEGNTLQTEELKNHGLFIKKRG